jgi:glyoxylase-like metal-dependent hydrolase (beta-lactamase superfamily II)
MKQVAKDVWMLAGFPRAMFNVYLAGETLIDAGTRWARWRILRQLRGRTVKLVALTHVHPDHQGAVRAVCTRFGVPLACHEADVPVMEGRAPMAPRNWLIRLGDLFWSGPHYPVGRVLRDGDEVGGFRVVHAPGHTPGHVMYFRESDRLVIAGDVLANIHFLKGRPGLREPPPFFCTDFAENRRSILTLCELRPSLVCFGHGPPLRDVAQLERIAERLHARGVERAEPAMR